MYQVWTPITRKLSNSREMHTNKSCLESFFLPDEIKKFGKDGSGGQPRGNRNKFDYTAERSLSPQLLKIFR